MPVPPPGFAPAPAPTGFAPLPTPSVAMTTPAATTDTTLHQKIDQLLTLTSQQATQLAALKRALELTNITVTVLGRAMYQKQGVADIEKFLQELNIPLPQ